jgi:hypothetical protein
MIYKVQIDFKTLKNPENKRFCIGVCPQLDRIALPTFENGNGHLPTFLANFDLFGVFVPTRIFEKWASGQLVGKTGQLRIWVFWLIERC